MTVQFNNFSPHAFERLAQALCVKSFGPGTVVFGSGPDGAREATFDGEIPFPSAVDRWRGYIVVQAKCREKLRQTGEDADWLCSQLSNDLDKFLDTKRSLKKPNHFLLISNVNLSSVLKTGGKAKVEKVFRKYKSKIGLAKYAVWGADELRALLDDAEDIRRAFTAWLTPSDVLADLVEHLSRPNLTKLLPLALARDLRDERDVRLKDAGQETDKAVYLEDVFIDLPLANDKGDIAGLLENEDEDEEGEEEGEDEKKPMLNAVFNLLNLATDKLDPSSVSETRFEGEPLRNRIVILGGPGQGKSTLSQFLMQLQRARLLSAHKPSAINPQTSDLILPILERARIESLELEGPVRFPIRINLPDFADAMQSATDARLPATVISDADSRAPKQGSTSCIPIGNYPN